MSVTYWTQRSVNYTSNAAGGKNGLTTTDAAYTVQTTDDVVLCDATATNQAITLPTPVGLDGKQIVLKRIDAVAANTVTVTPAAATIDGLASVALTPASPVLNVVSNGVIWRSFQSPGALSQALKVAVKTGATYTLLPTDDVIVGNSAVAQTFTLPPATASGKVYNIKQVGNGAVTVVADVTGTPDTIDGQASWVLAKWSAMALIDYAANLWAIL